MRVFALFTVLLLFSCSSAEKRVETPTLAIEHVYPYNIQIRRPEGIRADPDAEWGDSDFYSNPKPDSKYDCQPIQSLFSKINLKNLQSCLNNLNAAKSAQSGTSVEYQFYNEDLPFLVLENSETAPSCLKENLPQIPVAREIFFQSPEISDERACFSSAIDFSAGKVLGIRWPLKKYKLKIEFPLKAPVESDRQVLAILQSWSLAPFRIPAQKQSILARPVPATICKRCFGKKNLITDPRFLDSLAPN